MCSAPCLGPGLTTKILHAPDREARIHVLRLGHLESSILAEPCNDLDAWAWRDRLKPINKARNTREKYLGLHPCSMDTQTKAQCRQTEAVSWARVQAGLRRLGRAGAAGAHIQDAPVSCLRAGRAPGRAPGRLTISSMRDRRTEKCNLSLLHYPSCLDNFPRTQC